MPVMSRIILIMGEKVVKICGQMRLANWSFPGRFGVIITEGFTTVYHLHMNSVSVMLKFNTSQKYIKLLVLRFTHKCPPFVMALQIGNFDFIYLFETRSTISTPNDCVGGYIFEHFP